MSASNAKTLDRTFAGGLAWTAGVKYLTQGVTWAALIVTAKLLSPADFGISQMAAVFVGITNVMAEFGVGTAVLQMREMEDHKLRQMHTFSCIVASLFFGASLLMIPLLTRFFNKPGLELLFASNCVAFLITGFQAVPAGLLQRDMDYRRLALVEALQMVVQSAITVAAAFAGWRYWSLVAGAGAGKLLAAIVINVWKPVPFARIHWPDIRNAVRMGGQVAVGRLAWSAYVQADAIIVGRVLGDVSLGVYQMAMNLASAPAEKTSGLLMRATGPLFARIQNDLPLVRRYFLIITEMLLFTLLPLLLGLAVVAQQAIVFLFDPEWLLAAAPLQWLAIYMTLRPLGTLAEQVLISQRRTSFTMKMSIVNFCVLPLSFYVAAHWTGSAGVAATWLILAPVTILPMLLKLLPVIHLSLKELFLAMIAPVAAVGSMIPAILLLRAWVLPQSWSTLSLLAAQVAAGAVVYSAVLLIFFRSRLERYYRFIGELRS